MTASNAHSPLPFRRLATIRVCSLGLAIGLLATAGSVTAATAIPSPATATAIGNADPARQATGALEISNIDFKRGDGGAGRLILRFNGKGAMPDLRNQGSSVIVDVGNAALPAALQRPLNVIDFATPVQRVDAHSAGAGSQLVLSTSGTFESLAYQTGNEYVVEIVPRAAQSAVGSKPI